MEKETEIKDKERMDWLQKTESGVYYHFSGIGPMWEITSLPEHRYGYNTLREAIDAAMIIAPDKEALRRLQMQKPQEER